MKDNFKVIDHSTGVYDPRCGELDSERVSALFIKIHSAVEAHLETPPSCRERVYEALNALAVGAALILHGTGSDELAVDFFTKVLADQMESLQKMRKNN